MKRLVRFTVELSEPVDIHTWERIEDAVAEAVSRLSLEGSVYSQATGNHTYFEKKLPLVEENRILYDLLINALVCQWSDNGNLNAEATRDLIFKRLEELHHSREQVEQDVEETVQLNQ